METQVIKSPPPKAPKVGLQFEDDYIRELGDRIAALTPEEAKELEAYLKAEGLQPL
jgi:hypothetical protein